VSHSMRDVPLRQCQEVSRAEHKGIKTRLESKTYFFKTSKSLGDIAIESQPITLLLHFIGWLWIRFGSNHGYG
jgi:hypothetical protein